MTAATEQQPAVELPPLTTEELVLIQRIKAGTASRAIVREYLTFLTRRRQVVDALVKEACPEWPAVKKVSSE